MKSKGWQGRLDQAVPFLVFAATGLLFLPVINWLLGQTLASEQLLHGFLVFLLTGILLATENREDLRPVWDFSGFSQALLVISYGFLAVAIFTRLNLIVLVALALALAAFLLFVFGNAHRRLVLSSTGTFTVFTGMTVLMPLLDWPLRGIAGQWSVNGLKMIGQEVSLGLVQSGQKPILVLVSNGQPFNVAAECNGFGMVTSSLMMALIIVLYRRIHLLKKLAWLIAALILGLVFNALRIVIIVSLAHRISQDHYLLMHETIGLITTYGGLIIIYALLMHRREPAGSDLAENQ